MYEAPARRAINHLCHWEHCIHALSNLFAYNSQKYNSNWGTRLPPAIFKLGYVRTYVGKLKKHTHTQSVAGNIDILLRNPYGKSICLKWYNYILSGWKYESRGHTYTGRQTDRHTHTHTHTHADRQTDRHTDTHTQWHTPTFMYTQKTDHYSTNKYDLWPCWTYLGCHRFTSVRAGHKKWRPAQNKCMYVH